MYAPSHTIEQKYSGGEDNPGSKVHCPCSQQGAYYAEGFVLHKRIHY